MTATPDTDAPLLPDGIRGLLRPLRHRDFRLLVAGQTISTFGDLVFAVALPFLLLGHGGPRELGITLAVLGVARLASAPLGGMLADRWHPRTVMLLADGGRVFILLIFVYLGHRSGTNWPLLLVGAVLLGGFEGMFLPAYRSITPRLVSRSEMGSANAVGETFNIAAVILGPLFAGLAVTVLSPATLIAVNAVTFVGSAVTLLLMRRTPAPVDEAEISETPEAPEAAEAAPPAQSFRRYLAGSPLLQTVLLMTGILSLSATGVIYVALPVLTKANFAQGGRVFGFVLTAQAVGLLIGSIGAGRLIAHPRRGYVICALLAANGAILVVVPHLPGMLALLGAFAVLGLIDGLLNVTVVTLVQQLVPGALLGRVMAAFSVVGGGSYPLAVALATVIVTQWGVAGMFTIGGIGVLITALVGITRAELRAA